MRILPKDFKFVIDIIINYLIKYKFAQRFLIKQILYILFWIQFSKFCQPLWVAKPSKRDGRTVNLPGENHDKRHKITKNFFLNKIINFL